MVCVYFLDKLYCLYASERGDFMKTIFNSNNRGRSIIYVLFAVAILSFVAFFLFPLLFSIALPPFVGIVAFLCIMLFGGIVVQMRSSPPW